MNFAKHSFTWLLAIRISCMIHYFWSIALCSAIHKMNIRHFRICVKIDYFSDNTKLDGSQSKVEYNNPCVIKWSHTDVNELTKRLGNYCQQIWNKPRIFDLQWWNMPNCVLTWAEGTLNIYCRFNLFSIFHRRKCFIIQKQKVFGALFIKIFLFVLTSTTYP